MNRTKVSEDPEHVAIYVAGTANRNINKCGGWGYILACGDTIKEMSGGKENTTSVEMELIGIVSALNTLKKRCAIRILFTSPYIKRIISCGALDEWEWNNWKDEAGTAITNAYLWAQIRLAVQFHRIVWYHIRSPYGHAACERCIELAENEKKKITRDAASA